MKHVSSRSRSGRGARSGSNGPKNDLVRLSSKRSAGSSTTGETQISSSTDQSRSRTSSPRQQNSRGMDPGGLVVIPRRQKHPLKKSSKPDALALVATDGEERAIVAVPPSTLVLRNEKRTSSKKDRKSNNATGVNETAMVVYNSNGNGNKSRVKKSKSNTGAGGKRVKEESKDSTRQPRARPLYSAKENKESTSSSRPNTSTSRVTEVEDSSRQRSKGNSRSMSKSLRSSWKKLSDVVKDKSKNKMGGGANGAGDMSPDKPAKKKTISKRKKSTKLNSISGSSVAIRSFSESRGYGSWQDGGKLPGKTTTSKDRKEEVEAIAPSTAIVVASPVVSARNNFPSRQERGSRRQTNERAVLKHDRRSYSPPSPSRDNRNRRSSSSPQRGDFNRRSVSPESVYSRDSYYSRSRSPSPSPRRNRRSFSPQSSRASSYSGSRSPSPRWRRSLSPRSCASYSRSRSPSYSPRRRRSVSSERSCARTVHSVCSRSRSPSPRHRRARSISPPSARGRRIRIFRSPSRSPSPRKMRQFGEARRVGRRSPPRMNYNRRDSFHSLSPPRRRRPVGAMRTNNMVPHRRRSFSSRSPSLQRRWGRRQTIARGNMQQHRRGQRPQRRHLSPSPPPSGISNGVNRRRSSSPPWDRSSSHQQRFGRHNSDIDLRAKVTSNVNGNTRRRQELQRRGPLEGSREMHSPSPQYQRRQTTGGYQRDVRNRSMPNHAVKSEALVVRDVSPHNENSSVVSMSALVSPRIESQSLLYKQTPRRLSSSSSSDSSGVWINCPEQYSTDDHEEELTFFESPNLREDNSDATCDAKNGFLPTPATTSVAHSFATYEVQGGSPTLSGRRRSKQVSSTPAKLPSVPQLDEDAITQLKEMIGIDVDVSNIAAQSLGTGLARRSTNESFPSDAKLGTPNMNIPCPPPRKTPVMPFAVPRNELGNDMAPNATSSVENSGANMGSSGVANRRSQSAQENDLPFSSHLSPPPPPFPRSDDSRVENLDGPSEGPPVANWQQYLTRGNRNTIKRRGSGRSTSPERESSKEKSLSRRKLFGKAPEKLDYNDRQINNVVSDMPYRDPFGDFGIYCGQVNESGRPNGKGSMKYDNGIFYEGMWTDGCQDEKAVTQYDRIRGGFTSWGGKGKAAVKSGMTLPWNAHRNDKIDDNDTTNVRGMEWVDLNGDSGRYTGEVNRDKVPHGQGIMKYSFGLIAEGEWVCGVLKENPQDRMLSAVDLSSRGQNADAMSVLSGGRSLALGGGMSVGPGMSIGGGMSVGLGPQGSMYGGMPQMQVQQMIQPQQIMMQPQASLPVMLPQANNIVLQQNAALVAQQNAMMQAGYGAPTMSLHPPTPGQRWIPVPQNATQGKPPITEIKFT